MNELDDKRLDEKLFKEFCEGVIKLTKLYKDGLFEVLHYCLNVFTSNEMPNIKVDTGIATRTTSYTHTSKFVKSKDQVNESQHIYLADTELISKVSKNEELMNAVVDLVVEYCMKYNNGEECVLTDNFKNTKEEILMSNDKMQDFIDGKLILTGNDSDRIGKEEMRVAYLNMYTGNQINNLQLLSVLKDRKIRYETKYRVHGVQGCYVGVKFRNDNDSEFEPSMFIKENDKAEYVRAEEFVKVQNDLNTKINKLVDVNETLQDELQNAVDYIKYLESLL